MTNGVTMYAVNYIDDSEIEKTEHKLYVLRDEEDKQMATLTYEGARCLLTAFELGKHIPMLTKLDDYERAGCWLGDGVYIEGRLVSAFTLERQTWFCYANTPAT